jgi:hypothetical protein
MTRDNLYVFCGSCRAVGWFNKEKMEKPPRCMSDAKKRIAVIADGKQESFAAGVTWDGKPLRK